MKILLIYLATLSTGGGTVQREWTMTSLEECYKSVSTAQIKVPNGGDAETTVSLFCAIEKNDISKTVFGN